MKTAPVQLFLPFNPPMNAAAEELEEMLETAKFVRMIEQAKRHYSEQSRKERERLQ